MRALHRLAPAPRPSTGAVAPSDAPLEVVDTGVPVITPVPGRFAWRDNDTLAITTFADPGAKAPWMLRKILAWDVPAHAAGVLVPRASSIACRKQKTWKRLTTTRW
jgi:hypothetical protein